MSAPTPEQVAEVEAKMADLRRFPHLAVVVARDPDNPGDIMTTMLTHGHPEMCGLDVAARLRRMADLLTEAHGSDCGEPADGHDCDTSGGGHD